MSESHRTEALKALAHVVEALAGPEPIEGLQRFQLRAALDYALSELALVQEVKRVRRRREGADE